MRVIKFFTCFVVCVLTIPIATAQETNVPLQILSRPQGAEVSIDGVVIGKTPLNTVIAPGSHTFSLRLEGHQTLTEAISIADRAMAISFGLLKSSNEASLRIFTNNDPANIQVDGVSMGQSPLSLVSITPGEHIISASKPGFSRFDKVIQFQEGESKVLRIDLSPPAATSAKLRVVVSTPDADVIINGERKGKAPVELSDLVPGTHFVTVQKQGYADWTREIKLSAGEGLEVVAALAKLAQVRLENAPRGASIYLDDTLVGTVPEDGTEGFIEKISVGMHELSIKHPNYRPWDTEFEALPGEKLVLRVDPVDGPSFPTEADREKQRLQANSFGAKPLPAGVVALKAGLGYPYVLGKWGATVGIIENLDASAELRSFGALTELAFRGRYRFAEAGPISLAAEASTGFGFGAEKTTDFFLEGTGIASLQIVEPLSVSARLSGQIFVDASDRADFNALNGSSSQGLARLNLGIGASYAINDNLSLEGLLEAAPGQSPRHLYEIGILADEDPTVYGHFGLTYKF